MRDSYKPSWPERLEPVIFVGPRWLMVVIVVTVAVVFVLKGCE